MIVTNLTALKSSREVVETFKGYNHNCRIGNGEFYDEKNMCSDNYPVLSTRPLRGTELVNRSDEEILAIHAKDELWTIIGDWLYHGNARFEGVELDPDALPKQMISVGAYIVIWPDMVYVNTGNYEDYGSLEAYFRIEAERGENGEYVYPKISFSLCDIEGNALKSAYGKTGTITYGNNTPDSPKDGQIFINTSEYNFAKQEGTLSASQYFENSSMWSAIDLYTKISYEGIGKYFDANDSIEISGFSGLFDDYVETVDNNENGIPFLPVLNATYEVIAREEDYIIIPATLPLNFSVQPKENTIIKLSRTVPKMDFVIESNNRLWGCRYGLANNGEFVNEIYASRLGNIKNWNCYQGLSTDSYTASVGTDGAFTGAINHLGYPLFFKENSLHKIYGSYPAQYQIQTTSCRGVQKGCEKSLTIVNEVLYYKSVSGVCAYDGSLPVDVASALGGVKYDSAVSGSLGNKLYICMHNDEGYVLFAYDTSKGIWHKEDSTEIKDFATISDTMYWIENGSDEMGDLQYVRYYGNQDIIQGESKFSWMVESGAIGLSLPDKKYISRFNVRLKPEIGTIVHFYARYDDAGAWEHLGTVTGTRLNSVMLPIRVRRCDSMQLRIEGIGGAKLYSITKTIEEGSDK